MKDLESIKSISRVIIDFLAESTPENELPIVDAIFSFGHYDPRVALHVAKLYKSGKAQKIILSGKGRDKIPSGFSTEADFYASIIRNEGITDRGFILEKQSTNTLENIQFGIQVCNDVGFFPTTLILCSLPPLLRRSISTFQKQFPNIVVCGSSFEMPVDEFMDETRLKRLLGEFDRFNEYAAKGDMIKVEVPNNVKVAIDKLKNLLE